MAGSRSLARQDRSLSLVQVIGSLSLDRLLPGVPTSARMKL
jgi:hypothetical protein